MHAKLQNLALKTVATQLSEAVVLANPKGKIAWANHAFEELCGYKQKELLGKSPGEVLQGKGTDKQTAHDFHTAIRSGLGLKADILNYHKDGHSYWSRVSVTPLHEATGALQGFIAIERDVTREHEHLAGLHDEVVHLYAAILIEEESNGLKVEPDDPFYNVLETY